jgi:VCBS repeat-containing protein
MNTPQAVDDYYAVYEDCIYSFDVMCNDLGGNAKILWSIDDSTLDGTTGITSSGDGTYDLLSKDAACVPELSDKGARIWIESGKIRYDASVFNYLGAGESVCDKFTYAIRMSNGTLSWATVTITINGTNDGPDIRVGSGDTGSAGLNETNSGLCKTGTLTVTDPDTSDTISTTIALTSATGPVGGPSNAVLQSMLSVTPASGLAANNGDANNLTWKFDSGSEAFNYLRAGQTLQLVYTLTVNDGTLTDTQTVTLTITGTNDVPVLSDTSDPSAVAELGDASAQDLAPITGNFSVTDLDNGDTLDASVVGGATVLLNGNPFVLPAGASALTAAGAFSVTDTVSNGGAVNIGYSYDPGAANLDFLGAGESLTITYTVQVNDGTTNSGTQNVTFTITGTNDAPVLSIPDTSANVTEDVGVVAGQLNDSGALSFSDADANDLVTISASYNTDAVWSGGSLNAGQIAAITAGFTADSNSWDYTVANAALDFLGAGESITLSFTVTATDDSGAGNNSDSEVVTLTITGTNDAPVLTGNLAAPINEGGTYQLTTADVNFTDPDDIAANVTFTVSGLSNGTLYVNGIAATSFTGQQLADGLVTFTHNGSETLTAGFNVLVEDGNEDSSAPVAQPFNFTVNPVNDAPVNIMPGGQSVNEDTAKVFSTANGNAISISDSDAGSNVVQVTLSVASGTLTMGSLVGLTVSAGANGSSTVTVQGTLAAINAGLQGLTYQGNLNFDGGDSLSIVTSDLGNSGSGGPLTDSDSVAITVNAVNDAPVNNLPAGFSTNEDTALKLAGISVTDVDAAAGNISVTLSVATGTLFASNSGGVTISGSGTGSLVLSGTLSAINTYLATVANQPTFTPVANASGSVTLTMTTSDNGNTGSGGTLVDTDMRTITVAPVNDNPTTTNDVIWASNNTAVTLPWDALLGNDTDPDGLALTLQSVVLTTGTLGGGGVITVNSNGTFSFTTGATGGTVASPTTVTLTYTTIDNAGGSATGTITLRVVGVDTGGSNQDTINLSAQPAGSYQAAFINGGAAADALTDGSGFSTLIGGAAADTLTGNAGNDLLIGGDANDTLSGGDGNDVLRGGLGNNDSMDGGNGTEDMLDFSDGTVAVTFTLDQTAGSHSITNGTGGLGNNDTYQNIEGVIGTSSADTITGSNTANDILRGGGGNDVLDGAGGTGDLLDLSDATAGFTINFSQGVSQSVTASGIGTDTYSNFEGVIGSAFNDTINGSSGNDILRGGGGNDVIDGGAGNDTITGGTGADTMTGGIGNDVFVFNSPTNAVDTITDFEANGADKLQLDDAIFTQLTPGALSAANFVSNSGGVAGDANDYILFDSDTGNLYYDADGNGAGQRILIATITVAAGTIDPTDILII